MLGQPIILNNRLTAMQLGNIPWEDQKRIVHELSEILVADSKSAGFYVDASNAGKNLVSVWILEEVAETSATKTTVKIKRLRSGAVVDMLSTPLTIDKDELTSKTAAVPYVINTSNDDLLEGDYFYPYVETPIGSVCRGLTWGFKAL